MEKLDKAAGAREASAGGRAACEDPAPARAWKSPSGRAHTRGAGLRLDTLGSLSILSERSGSIVGYKSHRTQSKDMPELGSVDGIMEEDKAAHGDHDVLSDSEQDLDEVSVRDIPKETVRVMCAETAKNVSEETVRLMCAETAKNVSEETVRLMCAETAKNISEVLGAELRGCLQTGLKEEVSRAVREEFQRCAKQLQDARPQKTTAETGCQADGTTALDRPGHARSDGNLPWPSGPGHARSDGSLPLPCGATFPQPKATSLPSLPRMPTMPHPPPQAAARGGRAQRQNLPRPGDEACGDQRQMAPKLRDEAHHHTGCGDSIASEVSSRPHSEAHHLGRGNNYVSGVAYSRQSSFDEEASFVAVAQRSRGSDEVHELLRQQGLVKYASTKAAQKRSGASPESKAHQRSGSSPRSKAQAGPAPWRPSTRKSTAPSQASERARLIGIEPRDAEQGTSAKPAIRLNKKECIERGNLERQVTNELFRTMDLLPPEDDEKKEGFSLSFFSRSTKEKKHTQKQDAWPLQVSAVPYTTEASWQSEQESRCSFGGKWDHAPSKRDIEGSFISATPSNKSEDIVSSDASIRAANLAMEAIHPGMSLEGSLSQSSSLRCRNWFKFPLGMRVPSIETLRKRRDQELVQQLKLEFGTGEFDDIAPAPTEEDESEKRSQLAVWAAYISGIFGTMVAPASGVVPWEPKYRCLSMLYQWIILGLVSKCVYHSVTRTYQEWEMGESSKAVVHALDSVMGAGALMTLLACGAIWRSRMLVKCCKLLMAYSCKVGILIHWEEVSSTDFFCTVGVWLMSVLTVTLESLYFEVFTNMEDLLAHIGCFALFTFILMGMSQFVLHMCRFLIKMIDTFCYHTCKQPDFSEALSEWSLMQALCRSVCSSIQCAFVTLQATATAVVLLTIQQVGSHDVSRLMALAPGLIVAMGVFRTSFWAAAVTDKCTRVPMLVNSVTVGNLLDQDRMYAVHYIVYSQAGFYLFELRLTSSAVLKTAYIACAVTFYLATRVFAE